MSEKPVFEWDGYNKKARFIDKVIVYIVWIVTLLLIVGMGVLINKRIENRKQRDNIVVSVKLENTEKGTEKVKKLDARNKKEDLTINSNKNDTVENIIKTTCEANLTSEVDNFVASKNTIYSLKIEKLYETFNDANKDALEYENLNFKVYIVPLDNGYYLELEHLSNKKDAEDLKSTLKQSGIPVEIVKASDNYLLPQKKLEEELKNLISQAITKETEITSEVKDVTSEVENNTESEKSAVTSEPTKEVKVSNSLAIKNTEPEKTREIQIEKDKKKELLTEREPIKEVKKEIVKVSETKQETTVKPKRERQYFCLQAGAYSERFGAENLKDFLVSKIKFPVFIKKINGLYKVMVGKFENYKDAKNTLNTIPSLYFDKAQISFFITKVKIKEE